jgi:hypothetical protein
MITPILPNMIPMRDIKQISDGDRMFYELGHKKDIDGGYGDNWIRQGRFKEIENVKDFIENDKLLSEIEYLKHHNFMLIKKQ